MVLAAQEDLCGAKMRASEEVIRAMLRTQAAASGESDERFAALAPVFAESFCAWETRTAAVAECEKYCSREEAGLGGGDPRQAEDAGRGVRGERRALRGPRPGLRGVLLRVGDADCGGRGV